MQKNGAVKTREIERCKIGESLKSNARIWLKDAGYDNDDIEMYISNLTDTNELSVLPEEVQKKYKVSDCYVYVPLTKELIDRWYNEVNDTIKDIVSKEKMYRSTHDENIWWDDEESVKKESYYFSTLCGYSANLHKPYKQYLDSIGVNDSFDNGNQKSKASESEASKASTDNDDLSWLNDIL